MVTNQKIARLLRKKFGGGASPGEALVGLIVNLIPIAIVAVLLFVFLRDQGEAYAASMAGGAFLVMVALGFLLGAACGDSVGIADDFERRAQRDSQSFLFRNRVDDHLAAGMSVVLIQFLCGGLHKAIVSLSGRGRGPLGQRHFRVAVGIMKAILDNDRVPREKLLSGVVAADPRLSLQEVENVVSVLLEQNLLFGQGEDLTVPPELVHELHG